ncbi:hypothetical protein ASPSYDRAFT_59375 [Aspergillus sydowii CBS 593.65]|uniref:Uncharacterized protein n=1 Tax=Aspergillus sydowii CBS 593.65 TaxID=1036612 RepID=A0A1L9TBW5_9EURO|nr:uncharacterized protein ASPSYDRAFT_59375 [Aspergillus sydowii CBS 593.65]OJJ56928.1 hypothetical protein ASPSYDRAFT_59375 [Aspergillus sydowii CBS 593.65]
MRYTAIFNKTTGARRRVSPEWVPPMLRPVALVSLAVFSFALIAALEILRHYTVAQVLSPNNGGILFSARYLPTLAFIALGYIVKGVASDLKKITPWANMSGRWASGSHTVLLDYISALEIVAVFSAMRRKDWAVFIGLVCTFICGALVPLANTLAYVDLFAPRNITAKFTQTSAFRFDNSPLVMTNGSLTIPWNTTGTEPYARAISGRLGGAPRTLWTAGNYVFDQFSVPSVPNATATTEVNSIVAGIDCQRLRYTPRPILDIVELNLEASPDDLEAAGCNVALELEAFASPEPEESSYPSAWLNITQCSDGGDGGDRDTRILATYLSLPSRRPNGTLYYDSSSVTGLICSPRFTSQRARLSVNSTNSEITAFEVSSEPQTLDIKTSTEALWIYLQNPLDSEIQEMFGRAQLVGSKGVYNPNTRPVANMANITSAIGFGPVRRDTFMQVALQGHPENAPIGQDVFQGEVTEFAGKVWAEVISFLARSEASNELPGSIAVTDERILLRAPVVRTCQALLALLGIVAIICALRGRPKTVLEQDPGSLAAAGVMLSASDVAVEREMAKHALSSTQSMTASLRSTRFMLRQRNAGQQPGVTLDLGRGSTGQDPEERVVDMNGYHPASKDPDAETRVAKGADLGGWRPLPLRLVSKVALEVAAAVVMIGLGIMLWQSDKHNGLCVDTPVSSAALPLSTSAILVLFGYCFAGVDAAAQAQAPFNVLRKRPNSHTIFTDDLTLLGRLSGLGSGWMNITLFASAASYILIIPAMKLVAAGLFSPINTQVVDTVSVQMDTSLTTHLQNMHLEQQSANHSIDRTPVIKQACDFAEWETNPVFNLRSRPGIVGNLVLDNLTTVVGTKNDISDGVVEARVPAIAVDIQCEPIPSSDFNVSLSLYGDHLQGIHFAWACTTERCYRPQSFPSGFFAQTGFSAEIPSYSGAVSLNIQNESSLETDGIRASESVYSMYIADLTSLGGSIHSFRNMTPLPYSADDNTTVWATPDTLNVTIPPVVAAHCRRNLTIVDVNATFTRPTAVAIETGAHLLPWRPVSVDSNSIQYVRPYPDFQPEYFQPPRVEFGPYGQVYVNNLIDGKLWSNSLWPSRGSSRNFYELLAADAQHRAGNLSRLLTPAGLADSAARMYTAYCTQILSELRTFASDDISLTPSTNQTQTVPARLVHSQLRVHQDAKTTYILLALLCTIACFALLVFCRFPGAAVLPKEPGSIASRFSLLADSTLVRRLRQEKVSDVNEMRKWREPTALGWWRDSDSPLTLSDTPGGYLSSTSTLTSTWRWGVDIGQHVLLQSWKDAPHCPPSPPGTSARSPSPSPSQSSTRNSLGSTPISSL